MSDDEDIEVHFDQKRGQLSLSCGEKAYARLRDFVFAEAHISEIVGPPSLEACRMEIESAIVADCHKPGRRRRFREASRDYHS